ncbi:glyoxylate reductase [Xylariaceae sp. FL0804]|nr:glyoxylate reductase [Xylariaceae sp. FL0804]
MATKHTTVYDDYVVVKPKVLLLGKVVHAHESWDSITKIADVVTPAPSTTTRAAFLAECRRGAFAGVSVIYRTFDSTATTGRVDAEVLDALSSSSASLGFVCHVGAGYDSVDVGACSARHILVSNTPGAVDEATADIALFLLLGCLRNLGPAMASLRRGDWRGRPVPAPLGSDPRGKTLGILGMGGIGRALAAKAAAAFGMRVCYHNRKRLGPETERECGHAEWVGFEELLRKCDVLSLNLPSNPSTYHCISARELALTRPGVIVINTARGAVLDERALAQFLDTGHVAGAGLDVFEGEPDPRPVPPALLDRDNVICLPHMGTYTRETEAKMEECAMRNVRGAVLEGRLETGVPEQEAFGQGM